MYAVKSGVFRMVSLIMACLHEYIVTILQDFTCKFWEQGYSLRKNFMEYRKKLES